MADPTRKAEDAVDAVVDDAEHSVAWKLSELRYIAAYAMARFTDVMTEQGTASEIVAYATQNSLPPVTTRTRRRRQRKLVQQMKREQEVTEA